MFAVLLGLGLNPAPGKAEEPGPGPLPWRVGGDLGFTADAAVFPDSASTRLEVYLRLPPTTLASLAGADSGGSRLRVSLRLRNRYGAMQQQASQEFEVAPADTGSGFGKVVVFPFDVRSGSYRLQLRLEDILSRKRGLAYIGRRVPHSAEVEGEVTVPGAEQGVAVSSPEFIWGAAEKDAAAFRHGEGAGVLPNPERLYGLLASDVRVRFYARQTRPDLLPWHWRATLKDRDGHPVAVRESTVAASRALVQDLALDVSTEPAGAYDLALETWLEGDAQPVRRSGRLSVAWRIGSWLRNPRDIEDEAHFLLESEDEDAFALMSSGEQERYLEDFWRERDPTPASAENEARRQFFLRIEHANHTWTRANLGKGMFTDMGRVYIRHGEPDEILRQVMPAGDQTLAQLLQQLQITQDRPTGDLGAKGLGGDVRPFEVWVYDASRSRAITARPDADVRRGTKRLLFLFVDDQGYGDYRLRYSTE